MCIVHSGILLIRHDSRRRLVVVRHCYASTMCPQYAQDLQHHCIRKNSGILCIVVLYATLPIKIARRLYKLIHLTS